MTGCARVVVPGYPHHITQRGNRRQPTFLETSDYLLYKNILQEQCEKFGVDIWAYCLMPNHVHLIAVPEGTNGLRQAIGETHRRYTRAINKRMEWKGYLWQGRFASFPMDESYLLAAVRYVEMNPVKAGLVSEPEQYPWSSAKYHLGLQKDSLISRSPLHSIMSHWHDFLLLDDNENEQRRIRLANKTGQPLGRESFPTEIKKHSHSVIS